MEVREARPPYVRVPAAPADAVPPGYKQTEIGVIPDDWEPTALAGLSDFITKGSTPTTYGFKWQDSGVLFLRSECVSEGGLDLTQSMYVSEAAHAMLRRSEVSDGDILVTITGNVGRAILLSGVGHANINQHIAKVRVSSPGVVSRYVFHSLSQTSYKRHFASITTGQAYPQISLRQVRETEIAVPPTSAEQEAIAEVLSDADALIGLLEKLLVKKRQIKQGVMQELLTGKKRLPGFGGEWAIKRLGGVLAICHGKSQRDIEASYGPYPVLATGGEIGRATRFLCDKPSVLIGRKGTIDRPQFMDTPFWPVDTLFYSDIHQPNSAKFFFYRFCLIDWKQYNEASGVPSLNARTIERIEVPMPKPSEQTAISTVLSDIDAEIVALDARLAKARQLKQGMMQVLLTGNIRLLSPQSGGVESC